MNRASILSLVLFLLCIGCKRNQDEQSNEPISDFIKEQILPPSFDIDTHLQKYEQLKSNINQTHKDIRSRKELSSKQKAKLQQGFLSEVLIDSIFHYWKETPWDFNGHTSTPRQGEIACGYFITTTLRDAGVQLNRIKLAQQVSSKIIEKLCAPSSIRRFGKMSSLEQYLQNIPDNDVLIVGLDFHTGFIFKRNGKAYFAHSNYIDRRGVEVEAIEQSAALHSSKSFMIGNLTQNTNLKYNT